jgi:SAM-dependent methyltransferase
MTRLAVEREYHDAQAARRRADLTAEALLVDDDAYLDHESWIRPAMARLGDLRARRVLDLGCGHGMASVVLARRGAQVTGLELSGGYLAEARARAICNDTRIEWVQADAQMLPFGDGSFDCVWGNAILHHLDLERAADEIHRVLVPGGRAVFCEPWGDNPFLQAARRRLSYPGKNHTPDEEPLRSESLNVLRLRFPEMTTEGHQFLSMVRRLLPRSGSVRKGMGSGSGILRSLERADRFCLSRLPALQGWCRYMVIDLPRAACGGA